MAAEDLGGIKATAELDTTQLQQGMKQYSELLQTVNQSMGLTEKGFIQVENAGKDTANSINALTARSKELTDQLNRLDPATKQFSDTAKNLKATMLDLKAAHDQASAATGSFSAGVQKSDLASRAFSLTLGVLGANSIQLVIFKITDLVKQSLQLAVTMEGVDARARAVYGTSFPQMSQAAQTMSDQFKRSKTDMLDFLTGFGLVLDSMGLGQRQVRDYSQALTQLTVALGKAYPDKTDAEIFQTLQSGIEGNVRGLRTLGIVMDNNALKYFAQSQGIKTKVADMTDEQKAMLRTEYLLDETTTLQNAGAKSAGTLGEAQKAAGAQWKDLMENIGQDVAPVATSATSAFAQMINQWIEGIGSLRRVWDEAMTDIQAAQMGATTTRQDGVEVIDFAKGKFKQQNAALGDYYSHQVQAKPAAAAAGMSSTPAGFWDNQNAGAGAAKEANAALTEAKKLQTDIQKIETDILATEKKTAESNKLRLDTVRAELEEKKKMGILTEVERNELDRINNRTDYLKDKIADATSEWTKQAAEVKKLQDEIIKVNSEIATIPQNLQDAFDKIDQETATKKGTKIAELLKQQEDLQDRLASRAGLSAADQTKLQEITDELAKAKAGTGDNAAQLADLSDQKSMIVANNGGDDRKLSAAAKTRIAAINAQMSALQSSADPYNQGQALFQADDLGKIDLEAKQKKAQAQKDSDAKMTDDKQKLADLQGQLATAQAAMKKAQDAVTTAYAQVLSKQTATYAAAETATRQHVQSEVSQLAVLEAALARLSDAYKNVQGFIADPTGASNVSTSGKIIKRAGGGMVNGPGGPTGDMIPALLSDGEGVIRTAAVNHYGGPSFIHAINSLRFQMPRFASGGVVNSKVDNSRSANIVQHFHGQTAGAYSNPSSLKWHARFAMR